MHRHWRRRAALCILSAYTPLRKDSGQNVLSLHGIKRRGTSRAGVGPDQTLRALYKVVLYPPRLALGIQSRPAKSPLTYAFHQGSNHTPRFVLPQNGPDIDRGRRMPAPEFRSRG